MKYLRRHHHFDGSKVQMMNHGKGSNIGIEKSLYHGMESA